MRELIKDDTELDVEVVIDKDQGLEAELDNDIEVEIEAENEYDNDKGSKVEIEIKEKTEIEIKYVIFGLWLVGSITSPVINMKWKFRQRSNRIESGAETEKITGIEQEIDTIRNLQVNFDKRKEVK